MKLIETERLRLRWITVEDANFIMELLNDPSWLKYIGDKGVLSLKDARTYILEGPVTMYRNVGFGLFLTELKDERIPIGMCGLLKRESLEDVDIGFAFLPNYTGKGYAYEAAVGVLELAKAKWSLKRVVAITTLDNSQSEKLLIKLGFNYDSLVRLSSDSSSLKLFSKEL